MVFGTISRGSNPCESTIFMQKEIFFVKTLESIIFASRKMSDLWCNGSTTDSGSVSWGSNPYKSTNRHLNL